MFLVGIDIGKLSHMFCIMDASTGEFHCRTCFVQKQ